MFTEPALPWTGTPVKQSGKVHRCYLLPREGNLHRTWRTPPMMSRRRRRQHADLLQSCCYSRVELLQQGHSQQAHASPQPSAPRSATRSSPKSPHGAAVQQGRAVTAEAGCELLLGAVATNTQAFPLFPFFFFGVSSWEVDSESESESEDVCFLFLLPSVQNSEV